MALGSRDRSSIGTALGVVFALVAIAGTQFLGWEWGSGQLVPTAIGVAVAGIAIVLTARNVLN